MALGKNIKIDKVIPDDVSDNDLSKKEPILNIEETKFEFVEVEKAEPIAVSENKKTAKPKEQAEQVVTKIEKPSPDNIDLEDIKITYKPSKRKTQKRILVSLEGSFTLKNIHLLKEQIPFIFEHYDFLELKLDNITEFDVSAIQIFHLMRFIYGPQKKFIAIKANFSAPQEKLLNTCGFHEFQTQIKANN